MTPHWHDGPLAALDPRSQAPVVWSVATRTDPGVSPNRDDLRDAAAGPDGASRLARRLLARALIGHLAGCGVAAVVVARNALGAPIVTAPAGWHLSLSGREDRALISVARVPIGVDREPIATDEVMWDMLAPTEATALRALPKADRPAAWLRRWTVKEAHAKLIGEPRRIRPEAIATDFADEGRGSAVFEGRSQTWTRIAHGGVETVALWDAHAAVH